MLTEPEENILNDILLIDRMSMGKSSADGGDNHRKIPIDERSPGGLVASGQQLHQLRRHDASIEDGVVSPVVNAQVKRDWGKNRDSFVWM